TDPLRAAITQADVLMSRLDDGKKVHYIEVGARMVQTDGSLSTSVFVDYVHPTALGYSLLTDAIEPEIRSLLGVAPASAPAPPPRGSTRPPLRWGCSPPTRLPGI